MALEGHFTVCQSYYQFDSERDQVTIQINLPSLPCDLAASSAVVLTFHDSQAKYILALALALALVHAQAWGDGKNRWRRGRRHAATTSWPFVLLW